MRSISACTPLRLIAWVLLLALTLGVTAHLAAAAPEAVRLVTAAEAKRMQERTPGVRVVDVRTPEEFQGGHLKNAVLLPVDTVEARAAAVLKDKHQPLLVYCHSGTRSAKAAKILKSQGYTAISDLSGGITAWREAGFPIVK